MIDANCYMTIATADQAGLPWPSPVWYAYAGVRAPAPFRLYRARVSELFVIDGLDQRIRADFAE